MDDLLLRLEVAKQVMIKFSDLSVKQKRIEDAKKFDIHAVSIDEAIYIIKQQDD